MGTKPKQRDRKKPIVISDSGFKNQASAVDPSGQWGGLESQNDFLRPAGGSFSSGQAYLHALVFTLIIRHAVDFKD